MTRPSSLVLSKTVNKFDLIPTTRCAPSGVSELATGHYRRKAPSVSPHTTPRLTLATIDPSAHTSEPSAPVELRGEASSAAADSARYLPPFASSAHEGPIPRSVSTTPIPSTRFASGAETPAVIEYFPPSASQRIRTRSAYEENEDSEFGSTTSYTSTFPIDEKGADITDQHSRKRIKLDQSSGNGFSE